MHEPDVHHFFLLFFLKLNVFWVVFVVLEEETGDPMSCDINGQENSKGVIMGKDRKSEGERVLKEREGGR